jgi:hypothetical protein
MEVSFSDANLTTRVRAVRNICLVAVLLALPFSADAQQRRSDGRRSGEQRSSDQRSGEQRTAQRRADQRQSDNNRHAEPRPSEQRPATGLGPIGLPAVQPQRSTPWWERQGPPAWEQHRTPSWEKKPPPPWERPQEPVLHMNKVGQRIAERNAQILAKPNRRHHKQPPIVYVLPPYRYFPYNSVLSYGVASTTEYVTPPPPEVPPPAPVAESGWLQLEVEPRHLLQIFVDGLYVGTPADLGDELELRLGARRIELRAPGYRTLVFDTQIVPDRAIVYRGALEPIAAAPQAPVAPRAPVAPAIPGSRIMYLIPGCYMGNVQPTAGMLRPGCDLSKLQTIVP